MNNRMITALFGGALLGLVCVVGATIRSGFSVSSGFVFSLWFNRVLIGLVVGAPWVKNKQRESLASWRRAGPHRLVSRSNSASGFEDPVSFIAGILYGVILEAWLSRTKKIPAQ